MVSEYPENDYSDPDEVQGRHASMRMPDLSMFEINKALLYYLPARLFKERLNR